MARCISKLDVDIDQARPQLQIYARKLTRNLDDADDLLQETLLRICRYHHRHDPRYRFLPWAKTIMHNLFVTRLKKPAIKPSLYLEDIYGSMPAEHVESIYLGCVPDVAVQCESKTVLDQIMQEIQALNEEQRDLILDDISEQYTYQELADKYQIPIGTLKTRLYRIRQNILKKMRHCNYVD